jgi:hypothetical protein
VQSSPRTGQSPESLPDWIRIGRVLHIEWQELHPLKRQDEAAFICVNIDTHCQLNLWKGSLNGAVSFAKLQRRQDLKSFSYTIRAAGRF